MALAATWSRDVSRAGMYRAMCGLEDERLVLDAATGKALRTIDLRVPPVSAVVAPRPGHLFVLDDQQSNEGALLMLDARTGHQIAATRVQGWPSAALVDDADGRTFVASTAGVIMLDARTGAVLKMTALPAGSNG